MRVQVLVKMFKGRLEIYGDDENFTFDIKHNGEIKNIAYNNDDDIFKAILILEDKDTLCFLDSEDPFTFNMDQDDRWVIVNRVKSKVVKNRRLYLLAISSDSAKKGLFHNVQKQKQRMDYMTEIMEKDLLKEQ